MNRLFFILIALCSLLSLGCDLEKKTPYEKETIEYEKLAKAGDVEAMFKLASRGFDLNLWGDDISSGKQIDDKSLNWYKKSAEGGYLGAQTSLGFMYVYGFGVKRDTKEAFKWYSMVAKQDRERLMFDLEMLYRGFTNSNNLGRDDSLLLERLHFLADLGYEPAREDLRQFQRQ